tara:strand:- start:84 stop:656 length:573 start_codon:yes stop_codon:yes gene_type:complete
MNYPFKFFNKKSLLKSLLFLPLFISFLPFQINPAKANIEFQWDTDSGYKKLKWYQKNPQKKAKNKIFFFLKPRNRKTGLLSLKIKFPEKLKSSIKTKNISLCKVNIGGFDSKTRCLKDIPSSVELNNENNSVDIFPISPIPSSKDSYAIVFKIINPQRSGLYQFHSFGKSSGNIPVSSYLGSWTIKIDQL